MARKGAEKVDKEKRDMLRWTEFMDEVLLNVFIYQQNKSNRVDGTFTTQALTQVVTEVREKAGIDVIDRDKVKNRIKYLKTNFNECYDLFKHSSDIAWSPITKRFDAEPEVWEAMIQAKSSGKKWKSVEITHYDKLMLLYAKDRATDGNAQIAKEKNCRWASVNVNTIDEVDQLLALNDISLENFEHTHDGASPIEFEATSHSDSDPISVTSPKKKERKSAVAIEITGVKESIDNVVEVLKESNTIAEKTRQRVYGEHEVYAELLKLDLDVCLCYKAYDFLIASFIRILCLWRSHDYAKMEFFAYGVNTSADFFACGVNTSAYFLLME